MYGDSFPLLNSMKILELEAYLPVRFFGKTLQDFGADVYLVNSEGNKENKKSKLFNRLKKGKKVINLDLKKKENIKIFYKLVEKSDIVLDNKKKGFLQKYKIDINELFKINPKLILLSVSGYGISGESGKIDDEKNLDLNYFSSIKRIIEFFKNKDIANNKFINPLIIMSDLFGGCIIPLHDLSKALLERKRTGKGRILDCEITADLFSLSVISEKLCNNDKFSFSCNTKNLDYILFSLYNKEQNGEILNIFLKKICERLLIEVLNLEDLPDGLRLNLTRDYIDYFQLITKSVHDSVKYIKDLCKLLDKDDLIKQLKKYDFLEIYPVIHFNDLMQIFKHSAILKGNYIIDSLSESKNSSSDKQNKKKNKFNNLEDKDNINYFEDRYVKNNKNLDNFGITQKDFSSFEENDFEKNNDSIKPKF